MTLTEFKETLTAGGPPASLGPALAALWHDGRGEWDAAHGVAQDVDSSDGAWIHAYLHRKEGDAANAGYWYRRAGKPVARVSLQQEWDDIVTALLADSPAAG